MVLLDTMTSKNRFGWAASQTPGIVDNDLYLGIFQQG